MRVAAWLWRYRNRRPPDRWYVRQTPFEERQPVEAHPLYRIPEAERALLARALVYACRTAGHVELWTDDEIESLLEMADLLAVPSTP